MHDPIAKFSEWFALAQDCPGISQPTAMNLATATADGQPSTRIVLLKEHNQAGFLFYTNLTSRKSLEMQENPRAALCFYWMQLDRQIRVEGIIVPAVNDEADAYFASRPRARQIGAWASLQSQALASREQLEARNAEMEARFEGRDVPRPPHWSGWRLQPLSMEFWVNSDARLHEREIYRRSMPDAPWQHGLLYP